MELLTSISYFGFLAGMAYLVATTENELICQILLTVMLVVAFTPFYFRLTGAI